mmetsp:Transcript_442/g.867  ORF Transcript_442/g.867 Transcript_442/m.867 type:complete len:626 (-) Transcript_442:1026-2903(-)
MTVQDTDSQEDDVKAKVDANNAGSNNTMSPYRIGGPNTSLPFFAESFLGWSLCFSFLAVSGYHYGKSIVFSSGLYCRICRKARGLVRGMIGGWIDSGLALMYPASHNQHSTQLQGRSLLDTACEDEATWIPLTTHSRAELDRQSPWQRYLSLLRVFEKCYPEVLSPLMSIDNERVLAKNGCVTERTLSHMDSLISLKCNADAALIRVLRRDSICRRLASLAMRPYDPSKFATTSTASDHGMDTRDATITTLLREFPHNRLLQRLSKFWKHLLVLPSLEEAKSFYRLPISSATPVAAARNKNHANDANYPYHVSLILPAYHEKGSHLFNKLTKALKTAHDPNEVEVIIVDAGGCSDLEMLLSLAGDEQCDNDDNEYWGRISIFSFTSGGGRGPCLNFGAAVASGRILTFCHSDTTMPHHWDKKIVTTLEHDGMHDDELSRLNISRANSCAFSFGIDTSHDGLSMPFESSITMYYPPGIKAVETTANIRTHLFSLPYGDQVLSLHARVFEFIGGFPDQCLMEDYELVSVLRRRAALFVPPFDVPGGSTAREKVACVPGAPALCSPRRWQKFGVLYVTYMNSHFVNLYAGKRKMGPDDLFQLYYGRVPPKRDVTDSPWEVELATMLKG